MFDVGFSEIVVILVVALIVIGPERLPKVARTLGHLLGRMQRYVAEVKADVSREMELEELRKLQSNVVDAARNLENSVRREARETEEHLRSVGGSVEASLAPPSELPPASSTQPPLEKQA